ncbi:major facilitator superfamily domain-containing protein [Fusarium tricinctum]|uniref:Major facilitator superfamily domain-containing protein n=1 Tax=Fusarium tricinctum TaxID=61284 RepID=A0A8K0WB46_9HYPO|nr:major facilitator superfamily domain-containing protein [Fusarium tricinctum]
MYGGTHIQSFGLSLFRHCIITVSQSFITILPAPYSEVWFKSGSRATATAISSTANILGSTVGQFIIAAWVKSEYDITRGILYQSILLSVIGCTVVFIPSKPPTPPGFTAAHKRTLSHRQELQTLFTRPKFYLIAFPFGILSGIFNALSFLIFQMCMPYGFTADQCAIAVCLVIIPGLATSLIVSRAADMYLCHKWVLKILAVIMGTGFLAFIWVPPSASIAFLYCISIIISIGVVGSGPIAVEFVAKVVYPLGPEMAIAIM